MRRRRDVWTAAGLAAPLAAGAIVPVSALSRDAVLCPFRGLTGVPCPLCGATRAFVLFGHADGRWLDYGAVWVVVALAGLALVLLRGRPLGRRSPLRPAPPHDARPLRRRPSATLWAAAAVVVTAWAWALAHSDTIAPG